MELKPDSCCRKNLKDYYSRKCTLNQSNEKVLHLSITNGTKNARISKFIFDFFTERDGLKGYFWLQLIEKGLISQMCSGFLFMNACSWKSSYIQNFTHFRGTVLIYLAILITRNLVHLQRSRWWAEHHFYLTIETVKYLYQDKPPQLLLYLCVFQTIKYNCAIILLGQMYYLIIYASKSIFWSYENHTDFLSFTQGEVVSHRLSSNWIDQFEITHGNVLSNFYFKLCKNVSFGDFCALVYVMLYPSTSEDILWIPIYLRDRHITIVWHVSNHLTVIATSSIFVSDVVTWCFCWLVSTSKVITLCFWLPKIIFLPTCFCLNFSICTCR